MLTPCQSASFPAVPTSLWESAWLRRLWHCSNHSGLQDSLLNTSITNSPDKMTQNHKVKLRLLLRREGKDIKQSDSFAAEVTFNKWQRWHCKAYMHQPVPCFCQVRRVPGRNQVIKSDVCEEVTFNAQIQCTSTWGNAKHVIQNAAELQIWRGVDWLYECCWTKWRGT